MIPVIIPGFRPASVFFATVPEQDIAGVLKEGGDTLILFIFERLPTRGTVIMNRGDNDYNWQPGTMKKFNI